MTTLQEQIDALLKALVAEGQAPGRREIQESWFSGEREP